jgi:hypothetical protein
MTKRVSSLAVLAILTLTGEGCAHGPQSGPGSRSELAEFSYSTGCYQAYQQFCAGKSEEQVSPCFEEALSRCEKQGRQFRDWIESKPAIPQKPPARLE